MFGARNKLPSLISTILLAWYDPVFSCLFCSVPAYSSSDKRNFFEQTQEYLKLKGVQQEKEQEALMAFVSFACQKGVARLFFDAVDTHRSLNQMTLGGDDKGGSIPADR